MLINILQDIASEGDANLDLPDQKALLKAKINAAAREIYYSTDVENSLTEGVFNFDVSQNQVTLPWFVGEVRGYRWYDSTRRIEHQDIRNRYNSEAGYGVWLDSFREKYRSALMRDITNESVLRFSIPKVEDSDIIIAVEGTTDHSANIVEEVTLAAESLTAETIKNFKSPIVSISKNRLSNFDITVKDVEDRVVSLLPNCLLSPSFITIQVIDDINRSLNAVSGIEVLYKKTFIPLESDYASFFGSDIYDKAIFWKYNEHKTSNTLDAAAAFQLKCTQALLQISTSREVSRHTKIGFAPSPSFNMFPHAFKRRKY